MDAALPPYDAPAVGHDDGTGHLQRRLSVCGAPDPAPHSQVFHMVIVLPEAYLCQGRALGNRALPGKWFCACKMLSRAAVLRFEYLTRLALRQPSLEVVSDACFGHCAARWLSRCRLIAISMCPAHWRARQDRHQPRALHRPNCIRSGRQRPGINWVAAICLASRRGCDRSGTRPCLSSWAAARHRQRDGCAVWKPLGATGTSVAYLAAGLPEALIGPQEFGRPMAMRKSWTVTGRGPWAKPPFSGCKWPGADA